MAISNLVVVEDDEEELKSKNLVNYLGMKDGLTASIASQVRESIHSFFHAIHPLYCYISERILAINQHLLLSTFFVLTFFHTVIDFWGRRNK